MTPHSLSAFLCQDFYTEIFIHPFSVTDIDLSPANAGILSWTQVWQYQYHDSLRCIAAYSDAKVLTKRHFRPLAAVGRDPTRIIKSNTNFCDPFHPITFVFFFIPINYLSSKTWISNKNNNPSLRDQTFVLPFAP